MAYSKIVEALASATPVYSVELDPRSFYSGLSEVLSVMRVLDHLFVPYTVLKNSVETNVEWFLDKEAKLNSMSLGDFR
jgi:hypothetical protein